MGIDAWRLGHRHDSSRVIEARVMVTRRMHPLRVDGRLIHQVGLPYHWGYRGRVKGDVVNDLLVINEEPNVRIMETKALVCNVVPGRRPPDDQGLQRLNSYEGQHA